MLAAQGGVVGPGAGAFGLGAAAHAPEQVVGHGDGGAGRALVGVLLPDELTQGVVVVFPESGVGVVQLDPCGPDVVLEGDGVLQGVARGEQVAEGVVLVGELAAGFVGDAHEHADGVFLLNALLVLVVGDGGGVAGVVVAADGDGAAAVVAVAEGTFAVEAEAAALTTAVGAVEGDGAPEGVVAGEGDADVLGDGGGSCAGARGQEVRGRLHELGALGAVDGVFDDEGVGECRGLAAAVEALGDGADPRPRRST